VDLDVPPRLVLKLPTPLGRVGVELRTGSLSLQIWMSCTTSMHGPWWAKPP
jgi:hypothetical protein